LFISGLLELHSLTSPDSSFQPLEPDLDDFLEHLRPYALMHIKKKKEESGYAITVTVLALLATVLVLSTLYGWHCYLFFDIKTQHYTGYVNILEA